MFYEIRSKTNKSKMGHWLYSAIVIVIIIINIIIAHIYLKIGMQVFCQHFLLCINLKNKLKEQKVSINSGGTALLEKCR